MSGNVFLVYLLCCFGGSAVRGVYDVTDIEPASGNSGLACLIQAFTSDRCWLLALQFKKTTIYLELKVLKCVKFCFFILDLYPDPGILVKLVLRVRTVLSLQMFFPDKPGHEQTQASTTE